jgi:hypothetical protein
MLCSTHGKRISFGPLISVDCGQSLACMEEIADKNKVVLAGKLLESAGKKGRGCDRDSPGQYGAERQHVSTPE